MKTTATDTSRPKRIAELLKRQLAGIIIREISDPRIAGITIMHVDVSRDLSLARIYFSSLKEDVKKSELAGPLNDAASYLRNHLKKSVNLRNIPRLQFFYDSHFEKAMYMEGLINRAVDKPAKRED